MGTAVFSKVDAFLKLRNTHILHYACYIYTQYKTEIVGLACTASNSYSEGANFESQLGHRLSLDFRGFIQSLQTNADIVHLNMPRPFPSLSLPIHHSLINLLFDSA
jgi:hypothetical protein